MTDPRALPPHAMRRVIVESPYAGDVAQNVRYAWACLRNALERGDAPLASHILYTQTGILDDTDPIERAWGISAGHAWMSHADAVAVYTDRGISDGMQAGVRSANLHGIPVEYRSIKDPRMRCARCQGQGKIVGQAMIGVGNHATFVAAKQPCPDCNGSGVAHCCEGECAAPQDEPAVTDDASGAQS